MKTKVEIEKAEIGKQTATFVSAFPLFTFPIFRL